MVIYRFRPWHGLTLALSLILSAPGFSQEESTKEDIIEKTETAPISKKESSNLLGDWRVGPTIQLGVPHPINYGLDVIYKKTFSAGFSTGKYSLKNIAKIDKFETSNWDVRFRWHPFTGSFFVGAAYGQQELLLQKHVDVNFKDTTSGLSLTVPTDVQLYLKSSYITPHLGWMAVWDCGFTLGFEIGAQIPMGISDELKVRFDGVSPSQEATVKDSSDYKDANKKVDDAVKTYGKMVLPYITLIRLGWMI